ncbi:hypothetical protein LINGRAHAP2_LOCUS31384 [Linum grandiflorum]
MSLRPCQVNTSVKKNQSSISPRMLKPANKAASAEFWAFPSLVISAVILIFEFSMVGRLMLITNTYWNTLMLSLRGGRDHPSRLPVVSPWRRRFSIHPIFCYANLYSSG